MASSHFGSSTKRSSRVSKSFQLVKPKLYSSTSMFGGRGHQSHKRRAGSYPGGFSLLLSPFGGPFSIEHDCLVPVKQHAVLDVPAHSPRQHYFFQITAFLQQVVKRVAMGDADDILLNDRSIIENLRDVMAGSANQLYAARKRLVVRFGADKGRQKGEMNVDDPMWIPVFEIIRQILHV